MEYSVNVEISESEVAAACLVLAFKMKGIKVSEHANFTLNYIQTFLLGIWAYFSLLQWLRVERFRGYGTEAFVHVAETTQG